MTPDAPTWAEIERFLKIDGWTRLPAASRGGSSQDHIFYEKLLDDGELLQTHISHASAKRPSSGRFAAILREQLKVSREDFWRALRDRVPVDGPRPQASAPPEHDAWVIAVLTRDLHMTAEQVSSSTSMPPGTWCSPTGRGNATVKGESRSGMRAAARVTDPAR